MRSVSIKEFLFRYKDTVELEDKVEYKRVTIRTNNKGISLRDSQLGSHIGTKKQFLIKKGQFLLSKIDARNGAFGIVPKELDGAIITGNFWAYEINKDLLDIEWFNYYVSSEKFIEICKEMSSGTTNRKYLDEEKFLRYEVLLPSKEEQKAELKKLKRYDQIRNDLLIEHAEQYNYASELKGNVLQAAIKGEISNQLPSDTPVEFTLEKIKSQRLELVNHKKLKPLKDISNLDHSNFPFEIPEGWEWVRLDNIVELNDNSIRRGPFGSAIRKDMFVPKGENTYKIYEQQHAIKKNWKLGSYYINQEKFNELKRFSIEPNDIIISCAGTIGETYLIPDGIEAGIINQALLKLTLNNDIIDNDYFLYLFESLLKKQVNSDSKGSAMKNLVSVKYLKEKILFPLPPLEEQQRIVAKLKVLLQKIDTVLDEIEKNEYLTRILYNKLLKETFV